jgi:IS30 family transposase
MTKRRRFFQMMAQGWTLRGACRESEIGRSTGRVWKNGATVRRKDGTVKFVRPLRPVAVRVISSRFLSEDEGVRIADLASREHGPSAVGQVLSRAPYAFKAKIEIVLATVGGESG